MDHVVSWTQLRQEHGGELCRSQSTMCSTRTGSCLKPKPEYVTEELGMCCCNEEKRTKIHVKNVMMVLRGLSCVAVTDSKSTIGSKEVGRAVEESNVMDSICVVVFDTRLMQEPRLAWRIVVFIIWNANRSVQLGRRCSLTTHCCWRPRTNLEVVLSVSCVGSRTKMTSSSSRVSMRN